MRLRQTKRKTLIVMFRNTTTLTALKRTITHFKATNFAENSSSVSHCSFAVICFNFFACVHLASSSIMAFLSELIIRHRFGLYFKILQVVNALEFFKAYELFSMNVLQSVAITLRSLFIVIAMIDGNSPFLLIICVSMSMIVYFIFTYFIMAFVWQKTYEHERATISKWIEG